MSKDVGHWIGGRRVAGASGRYGEIFNPSVGEPSGRVAFARRGRGRRRGRRPRRRRFPAGPRRRRCGAPASCSSFKELLEQHADELAALITRRARQGAVATPRARSRAASRSSSSPAASRSCSRASSPSRSAPASTSTRCASRSASVAGITPFNFPAMVPMWMFPIAIACGNTFVLKPSERDPSPRCCSPSCCQEAGLPDGVLQRRQRRQGGGRRAARPSRTSQAVSFVGSTPIAEYVYTTGTRARQARAGAGRRQEPHGRDARRRSRAGGRRADRRRLRLGRRALHGDLGRGRGRRTPATRWSSELAPRVRALKIGPATEPGAEMGPLVTARAPRQGQGLRRPRRRGRRQARRRRPRLSTLPGHENGFFLGGCLFDRRHAGDADLQGRDLRPGAVGRARARLRRGASSSSTSTSSATAPRSSRATATPRATSRSASRSAWSASTCRSRCRWRSTASAAGSARCSATTTCTAPRACASTRA